MTSRPCAAIDTARLAETVVLPTPPLPPVTAITLTGREELSSANASARSRDNLESHMGACSSEGAGIVGLVARRRVALQIQRGANQPNAFLMGRVQVFRHPLPVAYIGDFQLVAQRGRKHRAETCRLVHLG